jgi:hypothetical protein
MASHLNLMTHYERRKAVAMKRAKSDDDFSEAQPGRVE